MNQELFTKFAECVKAGKVPGLYMPAGNIISRSPEFPLDSYYVAQLYGDGWGSMGKDSETILCHHIREWLTGRGWYWELTDRSLTIAKETFCIHKPNAPRFSEGSQLDWHLAAVVDIRAGKVTP